MALLKRLFILSVILALLVGCIKPAHIPPEDIVFRSSCGPQVMIKGFLDPENEGNGWMTYESWQQIAEQLRKRGGM